MVLDAVTLSQTHRERNCCMRGKEQLHSLSPGWRRHRPRSSSTDTQTPCCSCPWCGASRLRSVDVATTPYCAEEFREDVRPKVLPPPRSPRVDCKAVQGKSGAFPYLR